MDISNAHNLPADPQPASAHRYGVRVSAMATDPFRDLVGRDWNTVHWFATSAERDAAMRDLAARHAYNRQCDVPTIIVEPIDR